MENFEIAKRLLEDSRNILILSHRSPDGDTIGSNLALRVLLESMGKNVVSACADPIPEMYSYFPGTRHFVREFDEKQFDLFVNVDGSSPQQLVFPEKRPFLLEGTIPFLNIDHHISNSLFGTVNLVMPQACSATFILQQFFDYCGWHMSPAMATYLLLGHYYDTGSFMHSNTTAEVLQAAAVLVRRGANRALILKALNERPIAQLKLWGNILERVQKNEEGVVISGALDEDLRKFSVTTDRVSGVVDYLNAAADSRFCVLLSEDKSQNITKGSTRTQRNDVDLSEICKKIGGGGHKKASGFRIPGALFYEEYFHIASPKNPSV